MAEIAGKSGAGAAIAAAAAEEKLAAHYKVRAGNLAALLDGALSDARKSARQQLHGDDDAHLGATSEGKDRSDRSDCEGGDGARDNMDCDHGHSACSSSAGAAGRSTASRDGAGAGGTAGIDCDCDSDADSDADVEHTPDPLYADNLDEEDSKWVDEHMRKGSGRSGLVLQQSAAVLSCPACFSIVCLDCQEARGQGRKGESDHAAAAAGDRWLATETCDCVVDASVSRGACRHAVRCGYCNTVVGDFDVQTQSYVFHTVIPTL